MGSQIELTISITFIVLFSIAIIGFSIGFANDNSADVSIASSTDVNNIYNLQKSNLSQFKSESEDTYQSILDTTIEPGSDVVPSAGPFAITMGSLLGSLKNMITLPVKYIFGGYGSPFGIFFTTLIAVIGFILVLYLIKTWKGNP